MKREGKEVHCARNIKYSLRCDLFWKKIIFHSLWKRKNIYFWGLCLKNKKKINQRKYKDPMWKQEIIKHFTIKNRFTFHLVCFFRLISHPSETPYPRRVGHLLSSYIVLACTREAEDGRSTSTEVCLSAVAFTFTRSEYLYIIYSI